MDYRGSPAPADWACTILIRSLRALLRSSLGLVRRAFGLRPVEGFVDRVRAGEVRGWALDPNQPLRRVRVFACCEGRIVAETSADQVRPDLARDGRGDGRHGFVLRLPQALLDGQPRRLRIEVRDGWISQRLVGGDVVLGPPEETIAAAPLPEPTEVQVESPVVEPARVALLVLGGDGDIGVTQASWRAQDWPDVAWASLEDEDGAKGVLASAHTVVLAQPGDVFGPDTARTLAQSQPLADVATWGAAGGSGVARRPEARALGVLLGETLGAGYAVRADVFSLHRGDLCELLASDPRRFELWLAGRRDLRWTHLPVSLSSHERPIGRWSPVRSRNADGLEHYQWRDAAAGRASRLVPDVSAARVTLAVWPFRAPAWLDSALALCAACTDAALEVLVAPDDVEAVTAELGQAALGARLSVRAVDPPPSSDSGAWLRALGDAASGDVVVFCAAGVVLASAPGSLDEVSRWALSPGVGGATVRIDQPRGLPLSGLGLTCQGGGWRCRSDFDPGRPEQPRPVLAGPSEFLVVSRAKLAAVGGVDHLRFQTDWADLDLGLRLRRQGWATILFGDLRAIGSASAPRGSTAADLTGFDPDELADAAAAYPHSGLAP